MFKRFRRRSWGWWLVLLDRPHFKVKLLRFKRNGMLSRQYHYHRNELWLFLRGNGSFECGEGKANREPGEYSHVGRRVEHRYIALRPTWVLEVQYGEQCDEGDIVRV